MSSSSAWGESDLGGGTLARSAVGQLTLVDLDHVAESNTNRQIHALGDAYGKAKVDAMAERLVAINPGCRIRAVDEFATVENAASLVTGADLVLDCIDQVLAKAALIAAARVTGVNIVTCGAAGGRLDPTRIRCDDLARLPAIPFWRKCVTSCAVTTASRAMAASGRRGSASRACIRTSRCSGPLRCATRRVGPSGAALACAGYGSSVVVTAAMGFVAAGQALAMLSRRRRVRVDRCQPCRRQQS